MADITPEEIREIMLEGRGGTRFLNESPVQLDVWYAFGDDLEEPVDLLLTPRDTTPAAELAKVLHTALHDRPSKKPRHIAPVVGAVAARLTFADLIDVVLPLTGVDIRAALRDLANLLRSTEAGDISDRPGSPAWLLARLKGFAGRHRQALTPDLRTAVLVALLAMENRPARKRVGETLEFDWLLPDTPPVLPGDAPIWRVSRNRPVQQFGMSVETIKADAARRVFEVDCRQLTWAVIDSGIDGSHPAFRDHDAEGFAIRVDKAYDFAAMRELTAYDVMLDPDARAAKLAEIQAKLLMPPEDAEKWLNRLHQDAVDARPYDWEALSLLLEVPPDRLDPADGQDKPNGHGTHVAGVLAGDWREDGQMVYRGVCPTLRLYDLRVLGDSMSDAEFAIIAALAFVRWLNARNRFLMIHGVNLSIGLEHDMDNYACGRTPVCLACEATVHARVCVVAAAGNRGAQTFLTDKLPYRGYMPISIADPGNAELVITVGATHRERPHEYGVSFFSSRGPTGDGRRKPDVVAPGEKIDGPLPNLGLGRLDGTSMAAPHVSGVAAMLMALHPEMIGNPEAVKQTIVDSATDLGRERNFQGAGLVDALRALQAR